MRKVYLLFIFLLFAGNLFTQNPTEKEIWELRDYSSQRISS